MLSTGMARTKQTVVAFCIVVEQPVEGVVHSLQAKDGQPLDPKQSRGGQPLVFDFPVRVAPGPPSSGPKLSGDQVRREGPDRRFVYVCIGQLAGDAASPWSRRMKIDIHDVGSALLDRAARSGGIVETRVAGTGADGTPAGTGADGTPACATLPPTGRRVVARSRASDRHQAGGVPRSHFSTKASQP